MNIFLLVLAEFSAAVSDYQTLWASLSAMLLSNILLGSQDKLRDYDYSHSRRHYNILSVALLATHRFHGDVQQLLLLRRYVPLTAAANPDDLAADHSGDGDHRFECLD